MTGMANLHTELGELLQRHLPSKNQDSQNILMELQMLLASAPAPVYQYRNHPSWDTTWMDLDEPQIGAALRLGHTVERRDAILGSWEAVTEVPA